MNLSEDSAEKVYRAMRSLFRYSGFQTGNYPDILVDMEEKILLEAFHDLSSKEIYYIITKWPEFAKQQAVEQEIENDRMFSIIEREIKSLN
ncbi:MAG TPA: hypothetical protein VM577_08010 [Anaerovoracaceae bacterium]|nr:hypothetical protein [Anaerovoracaceae bacterium]